VFLTKGGKGLFLGRKWLINGVFDVLGPFWVFLAKNGEKWSKLAKFMSKSRIFDVF